LQPSWQRKLLILERNTLSETLPSQHVEMFDFGDGRLDVRWNDACRPTASSRKISASPIRRSWRVSG
jgi:hypothetical protein